MGIPAPYRASTPLRVADVTLDAPQAGEVLVEVAAAGLCHSDLSVIDGSRPRVMPMVMGHEAAGVVREVGQNVTEFAIGDHVVMSFVPACGRCVHCATGRAALCEHGARANVAGTLLTGARRFCDAQGQVCHHCKARKRRHA
jgi:alcohol dehydrogenase